MDPRFLALYNEELAFIRSSAAEFAKVHPGTARRLSLDGPESEACPDPYVERLLEGFAFLAARVQLKIRSRYSDLTQQLFELVYPNFLAPTPSCTILEFDADQTVASLEAGFKIDRGSEIRSIPPKGKATPVIFRTAHEVTLWPLSVTDVRYLPNPASIAAAGLALDDARAAIQLTVQATHGSTLAKLSVDRLVFYLHAPASIAAPLFEQIHTDALSTFLYEKVTDETKLLGEAVSPKMVGFEDADALLPTSKPSFRAYRLLQEYFALPERLRYFSVQGLRSVVSLASSDRLDIVIALDRSEPGLDDLLRPDMFRLHTTPAINLFPKSLDRLHVDKGTVEQRLLPDRSRANDYEVYSVERVTAFSRGAAEGKSVQPIYRSITGSARSSLLAYSLRRELDASQDNSVSNREAATYVSTHTYLALADGDSSQENNQVSAIDVQAMCTNRGLAHQLRRNISEIDLTIDSSAPVTAIRMLVSPTKPRPSLIAGASQRTSNLQWHLVSLLSLNHLSITEGHAGAEMLREMLSVFDNSVDSSGHDQLSGIFSVRCSPTVLRTPGKGPIAFANGLSIELELDDSAYDTTGILPLAAVLEQFFAREVSVNGLVQTTLLSTSRGLIKRWPVRSGSTTLL